MITLDHIDIRTQLKPGDLGNAIELHGRIYVDEFGFDPKFEFYVAKAVGELNNQFSEKHLYWIAEYKAKMVGFLTLMHHSEAAQLRFFIIDQSCRGLGLGRKMLDLFMHKYQERSYDSCFLWTTDMLFPALHLYENYGFELVEKNHANNFSTPMNELKYVLRN